MFKLLLIVRSCDEYKKTIFKGIEPGAHSKCVEFEIFYTLFNIMVFLWYVILFDIKLLLFIFFVNDYRIGHESIQHKPIENR